MRQSYTTRCTVVDGKLKLFDRGDFDRGLARFMDGQELDLTIEESAIKRTNAQNRFFHGPILKAFSSLGYHQQEAKDMLCLMFIPQDIALPDGSLARVPGHTSALTVAEFNALIDSCIQLAAENDIYIEDVAEWRAQHRAKAS